MFSRQNGLVAIKFIGLWSSSMNKNSDDANKGNTELAPLKSSFSSKTTESSEFPKKFDDYNTQKQASCKQINRLMLQKGIPGLTLTVSVKGEKLWQAAFGFCDVENLTLCDPDARMRIASISKSLFSAIVVGPLLESNKINLKDSIHKYLNSDEFPKKKFGEKERDITFEELLSHTSGIRHYPEYPADSPLRPIGSKRSLKVRQCDDQINRTGYYQRKTYRNVIDALEPFKDDPLEKEPGKYHYSTYGFTLLSAAIQKLVQTSEGTDEQIEDIWMKNTHNEWKLHNTNLDQDEVIMHKRARYYLRTGINGSLINAPYQDSSVKWAGGGLVSNTDDLAEFGTILIDSFKGRENAMLESTTVKKLWTEVSNSYCLGFKKGSTKDSMGRTKRQYIAHTGSALGASSVLIMYPESEIVVAILVNLGDVNLMDTAKFIAEQFDNV